MKTLKQHQKEVNEIQMILYGYTNNNPNKNTVEGCIYLKKYYKDTYNIVY